jgi:hypothetical protein
MSGPVPARTGTGFRILSRRGSAPGARVVGDEASDGARTRMDFDDLMSVLTISCLANELPVPGIVEAILGD